MMLASEDREPTSEDREPTAEGREPAAGEPAETSLRRARPRWALSIGHVPLFAFLALWFLLLSYLPLSGTWDLWGHVIYGEWILEHRSLPTEDPVMPLAEGMKLIDTAWLSQVILAAVEREGGADWLSRLFALTGLATYLILAWAFLLESRSRLISTLGVLTALAITWFGSTTFGPQSFGALCLAILLWLIVSSGTIAPAAGGPAAGTGAAPGGEAAARPRTRRLWIGVPLLFALWANLDGSFILGLAVLGCCALGRAIDVRRQSGRWRPVLDDPSQRRWLYLFELAAAATLLNPYGLDLLLYVLGVAVIRPPAPRLVLWGATGLSFALSWALLLLVLRLSRRRFPGAHVLLLAVFGAAGASGVGRLSWYGPVFALVLVPHLAELWTRFRRPAERGRAPAGSIAGWGCCATLVLFAFVSSPIATSLVGRLPRTLGQLVGPATPLALASHLVAHPPRGLIFNPMPWGHWLALHGPPGLETFVTSDTHLIPRQVWGGYLRLIEAGHEWQEILELYDIETVILDRIQQPRLAGVLRVAEGWNLIYDDNLALVFERAADRGEAPEPGAPAAGSTPIEETQAGSPPGQDQEEDGDDAA